MEIGHALVLGHFVRLCSRGSEYLCSQGGEILGLLYPDNDGEIGKPTRASHACHTSHCREPLAEPIEAIQYQLGGVLVPFGFCRNQQVAQLRPVNEN